MRYVTTSFAAALLAAFFTSGATAQSRSDWTVGEEREVDEGHYLRLLDQTDGWRIWQIQTKNGTRCDITKGIEGGYPPVPVGVGALFASTDLYLWVYVKRDGGVIARLEGRGQEDKAEVRLPGERFWTPAGSGFDPRLYAGKTIEVHVDSWRYPAIRADHFDQRGRINMAGYLAALDRAVQCYAQQR